VIKLPKNKYMPKQDVQLGKEAASEVRKQYSIIEDQHIAKYLTQIGNRLVAAAPTETEAIGLRVLVHAGEPERHQRVRAGEHCLRAEYRRAPVPPLVGRKEPSFSSESGSSSFIAIRARLAYCFVGRANAMSI
jgi:hypothetical protein